jgi:glycosyltransferase involved in cell wall biosynthesis
MNPPEPATTHRLAYVTSMATGGLAGFNARELREMRRQEVDVSLFVTKHRPGPYMPPAGVPVFRATRAGVLLAQLGRLLASPAQYVRLLWEAIRTKSAADFLIAESWSRIMTESGRTWIHCHWGDRKLFVGYYCSRITGLPLSVTVHGYELYANPNWEMFGIALNHCTRIITISEHNKRLLSNRFPEVAGKIQVIRLSADLPPVASAGEPTTRILIVGGFHLRKGYDTLLDALRRLDRDDIHLWIVGYKGPVDVPGLITQYGLQQRVTLFGHISDDVLRLLYTSCDVFCLPSRFGPDGVGEGLPVALMEAMAHGKPIVSTTHTAIPELVPDMLVAEGDAEGLARAIATLADNPQLRQEMGRRNRGIIERDFSNRNVDTLLQAFTSGGTQTP